MACGDKVPVTTEQWLSKHCAYSTDGSSVWRRTFTGQSCGPIRAQWTVNSGDLWTTYLKWHHPTWWRCSRLCTLSARIPQRSSSSQMKVELEQCDQVIMTTNTHTHTHCCASPAPKTSISVSVFPCRSQFTKVQTINQQADFKWGDYIGRSSCIFNKRLRDFTSKSPEFN